MMIGEDQWPKKKFKKIFFLTQSASLDIGWIVMKFDADIHVLRGTNKQDTAYPTAYCHVSDVFF